MSSADESSKTTYIMVAIIVVLVVSNFIFVYVFLSVRKRCDSHFLSNKPCLRFCGAFLARLFKEKANSTTRLGVGVGAYVCVGVGVGVGATPLIKCFVPILRKFCQNHNRYCCKTYNTYLASLPPSTDKIT